MYYMYVSVQENCGNGYTFPRNILKKLASIFSATMILKYVFKFWGLSWTLLSNQIWIVPLPPTFYSQFLYFLVYCWCLGWVVWHLTGSICLEPLPVCSSIIWLRPQMAILQQLPSCKYPWPETIQNLKLFVFSLLL